MVDEGLGIEWNFCHCINDGLAITVSFSSNIVFVCHVSRDSPDIGSSSRINEGPGELHT